MADDGTTVVVPAGALSNDVEISVESDPNAPSPSNATAVGVPHTFGPEGQTFLAPVTVTLPIDSSALPANATLASVVVLTAPAGSSAYERLVAASTAASKVSAHTTHFSTFVPAVPDVMPGGMDAAIGSGMDAAIDTDATPSDAGVSCTYGGSAGGGPDGSVTCSQFKKCGSNTYTANCDDTGAGTCLINGAPNGTTFDCSCGTTGMSCTATNEGGVGVGSCSSACPF